MGVDEEIEAFIEQTLTKFEKAAQKHGAEHFVKDTWLEPHMRGTLKDLYIQMKYICEYSRRDYIISQEFDYEKSLDNTILQKIQENNIIPRLYWDGR